MKFAQDALTKYTWAVQLFHRSQSSVGWKSERKMPAGVVSPSVSLLRDGQLAFVLKTRSHSGWSRTLDEPPVFASCTPLCLTMANTGVLSLLCAL